MQHSVASAPGWPVESQNRPAPAQREYAEQHCLPQLVRAWQIIEQLSHHRWHATSYWRTSPSHARGIALDLAPDIAFDSQKDYAYYKKSDPVLYKRETLLRELQAAIPRLERELQYGIGLFVEPDHIHMQLFPKADGAFLAKWKIPKPLYPDTQSRMKLPLMK